MFEGSAELMEYEKETSINSYSFLNKLEYGIGNYKQVKQIIPELLLKLYSKFP